MDSMIRFQIYLTREQKKLLDEESKVRNKSVAEVVRNAIDEYLGNFDERG